MQVLRRGTCVLVRSRHCERASSESVTVYVRNAGCPAVSRTPELPGKHPRLATVFSKAGIVSPHPSDSLGTNYKGCEFYRPLSTKPDQLTYSSAQVCGLIRKLLGTLRTCNIGPSLTPKIDCPTLGLGGRPRSDCAVQPSTCNPAESYLAHYGLPFAFCRLLFDDANDVHHAFAPAAIGLRALDTLGPRPACPCEARLAGQA
jgi:hypothetical protein